MRMELGAVFCLKPNFLSILQGKTARHEASHYQFVWKSFYFSFTLEKQSHCILKPRLRGFLLILWIFFLSFSFLLGFFWEAYCSSYVGSSVDYFPFGYNILFGCFLIYPAWYYLCFLDWWLHTCCFGKVSTSIVRHFFYFTLSFPSFSKPHIRVYIYIHVIFEIIS